MKKSLLSIAALLAVAFGANAQDTPLSISGYADTYYKFDFAEQQNIKTSFATDQNSVSIGMIGVALKKTTGKASFVGELSFGPRGQYQSIPTGDLTDISNSFHIQNLNVNYAFTPEFSMTAGYFGTFVGYEVIAPTGNFNYSTSYLFTNGPFQNAGIKATYAFSPKVSLMVGGFNDKWNNFQAAPKFGVSTFGAQLMVAPVEGWTAYANVLSGYVSGTILDLTTSYQVSKSFKVGINAADWSAGEGAKDAGYTGGALYLSNSFTEKFGLGIRGEYFKTKKNGGVAYGPVANESVVAATLTANFKAGGLTFIPEFRLDNSSNKTFIGMDALDNPITVPVFMQKNGAATKQATQFSLAVVYAF